VETFIGIERRTLSISCLLCRRPYVVRGSIQEANSSHVGMPKSLLYLLRLAFFITLKLLQV